MHDKKNKKHGLEIRKSNTFKKFLDIPTKTGEC